MSGPAVDVTVLILRGFQVMLWLTLVPLGALMVVGILLSLLFSILQINDQSLPIAAKIVTIIVVLLSVGSWMSYMILSLTQEIFAVLPRV